MFYINYLYNGRRYKMKKIICIMLIGIFCTIGVFAEETEKKEPVKIEWKDRQPVEKGALIVWSGLVFTITAIVMQEVTMGDYR